MNSFNRHTWLFAFMLIAALSAEMTANAAVVTGPIVNPANNHSYYLLAQSSWQDAETEAVSLSGHLATINDAAEQSWVFNTFGYFGGTDHSLWIGLNDAAVEGNFVWTSGEPLTYTNWISGQPDNNVGGEDYVHMMRDNLGYIPGTWNDLGSPNFFFPSFEPIQGVVEVVPEPSGMALTGSLLAAVAALIPPRRRYGVCRPA